MKKLSALLFILFSSSVLSSIILLDQTPIPDLRPTMYYIANEAKTECAGRYNGSDYDGSEVSEVLTPEGSLSLRFVPGF